MRLLHTFDDQKNADRFSRFLAKEGIENHAEILSNKDWGSHEYGSTKCTLWVAEENDYDKAKLWLEEYLANPEGELFHSSSTFIPSGLKKSTASPTSAPLLEKKFNTTLTALLLFICTAIYFWGALTTTPLPFSSMQKIKVPCDLVFMSPIYKALFFDYPRACEIEDKIVKIYGLDKLINRETLPPEGIFLLGEAYQARTWTGFYSMLTDHFTHSQASWNIKASLFEKIREGEVWRLFTPCLLHASVFHLFFNMIGLVYLGKIIENRLNLGRYLFLVLLIGISSNTAQYLMDGPNFLGISGIVFGMLTFIWAREIHTPWEGYRLAPGVFSFSLFTLLAMVGWQLASFLLQIFKITALPEMIANTAHITGALIGYLMGRLPLMAPKN